MSSVKNKYFLNGVLLFSVFALFAAYFIEFILGHKPCNLCLIERIPYFISIILISIIIFSNKYGKILSLIVSLIFLIGAIISFYHFGIEQGFFEESTVCGLKDASSILSKEEILKQLQTKSISCKDVTFRIFGFSLTTFNMFISLILVFIETTTIAIKDKGITYSRLREFGIDGPMKIPINVEICQDVHNVIPLPNK